jgi:hypothetical protein
VPAPHAETPSTADWSCWWMISSERLIAGHPNPLLEQPDQTRAAEVAQLSRRVALAVEAVAHLAHAVGLSTPVSTSR